jgi:hypothetical protein
MNKLTLSNVVKTVQTTITKHSPEILTGLGIAGMVTTTIMAVKATPKAMRLIEDEKIRQSKAANADVDKLKPMAAVKVTWKCYIPAVVTGTVSIACLVGASTVSARRNAVLATAYTLSETALSEYKEKVIETVGEKKEEAIRDKVAKDCIDKNPVKNHEVIITKNGNTLCYDAISGRYFKSNVETIRKVINELNRRMLSEMYISMNDLYYELGLTSTKLGDDLGWNVDKGLIEVDFSSQLTEDNEPCLVLNYLVEPRYDFTKLM